MNDFAGMEDLLSDFLLEAGEMLSEVDSKIMDLENTPEDGSLLNEIYRGFHTIKGGAGFLNANELVELCTITENLFDKLRNRELVLTTELMVVIFSATAEVRTMFGALQQNLQPSKAPGDLIDALNAILSGDEDALPSTSFLSHGPGTMEVADQGSADWDKVYKSLTDTDNIAPVVDTPLPPKIPTAVSEANAAPAAFETHHADVSGVAANLPEVVEVASQVDRGPSIRVDTSRLDQVVNLSSEINLVKNHLTNLRTTIIQGRIEADTLDELDHSINQLDMLVANLQIAVTKTRMQPIGRLFDQYVPMLRDLGRLMGKEVELVQAGEDIEMDATLIQSLSEPLLQLVRNAIGYGGVAVESQVAAGNLKKSIVELSVRQESERVMIAISGENNDMRPEAVRAKAIENGLITAEAACELNDARCLELIFLPGYGCGMDAVKVDIHELNGEIDICAGLGQRIVITISLPLKQAVMQVLVLRLGEQSFAVPLSMMREIVSVSTGNLQQISGHATMMVRGEALPVLSLAQLIGWEQSDTSEVGVLIQSDSNSFVMLADSLVGQEDVMVKAFDVFRPKGVAAVTVSGEGEIVLILDIKELISEVLMH